MTPRRSVDAHCPVLPCWYIYIYIITVTQSPDSPISEHGKEKKDPSPAGSVSVCPGHDDVHGMKASKPLVLRLEGWRVVGFLIAARAILGQHIYRRCLPCWPPLNVL